MDETRGNMRWEKRGLVLPAPTAASWAVSHAALPMVDGMEDGKVRVLFSARDEQGRAQTGLATLGLDSAKAPQVYPDPLVTIGLRGTYEDAGATGSCVVDAAGRRYLYYTGWTLGVTVPFYLAVGLAISDDGGVTYRKVASGPILPLCAADPLLTASPWVIVEDNRWRMWYVSGTSWRQRGRSVQPCYHLKYAESEDGIAWEREGRVVVDYRDDDEFALSRPCVVKDGDRYRMWFSSRGDTYRIRYAESPDGLIWERKDDEVGIDLSPSGWDSEMQAYPFVFRHEGSLHMLYNGNGYGMTGIGHAVLAS